MSLGVWWLGVVSGVQNFENPFLYLWVIVNQVSSCHSRYLLNVIIHLEDIMK